MKKILIIASLLCLNFVLRSQTAIEHFLFDAQITNVVANGADTATLTVTTITPGDGFGNGTNIAADSTWFVWKNCDKFRVIGLSSQFSASALVQVKLEGNPLPNIGGGVSVLKETTIGDGLYAALAADGDNQCMASHYSKQRSDAIVKGIEFCVDTDYNTKLIYLLAAPTVMIEGCQVMRNVAGDSTLIWKGGMYEYENASAESDCIKTIAETPGALAAGDFLTNTGGGYASIAAENAVLAYLVGTTTELIVQSCGWTDVIPTGFSNGQAVWYNYHNGTLQTIKPDSSQYLGYVANDLFKLEIGEVFFGGGNPEGTPTDNFIRAGRENSVDDGSEAFTFLTPFDDSDGTTDADIVVTISRNEAGTSVDMPITTISRTGFTIDRDNSIDGVSPFSYIAVNNNSLAKTVISTTDFDVSGWKDYSTTEKNTGRKWIDGKDIYRQVIEIPGTGTAGTDRTINHIHGITGIDNIISTSGGYNNGTYPLNGMIDNDGGRTFSTRVTTTQVETLINSDGASAGFSSGHVILEYTKN